MYICITHETRVKVKQTVDAPGIKSRQRVYVDGLIIVFSIRSQLLFKNQLPPDSWRFRPHNYEYYLFMCGNFNRLIDSSPISFLKGEVFFDFE